MLARHKMIESKNGYVDTSRRLHSTTCKDRYVLALVLVQKLAEHTDNIILALVLAQNTATIILALVLAHIQQPSLKIRDLRYHLLLGDMGPLGK